MSRNQILSDCITTGYAYFSMTTFVTATRRVLAVSICCSTVVLTGCASANQAASSGPSGQPSVKESGMLHGVALTGGTYRWELPHVTLPAREGNRPSLPAGPGPDPVTGSTMYKLRDGSGAAVVEADQAKVRWLSQSWDGQHVGHDSWATAAMGEPLPSGYLGARMQLAALHGQVGDLYEIVAPANKAGIAGQSAIVVVEFAAP